MTFVTHSDMRERGSSMAAAATLCSLTGGLLYDPQSGDTILSKDALAWAREQLAGLQFWRGSPVFLVSSVHLPRF